MLYRTTIEYETGQPSQKALGTPRPVLAHEGADDQRGVAWSGSLIPYYHAITGTAPPHLRWVQPLRSPQDYIQDLGLLSRVRHVCCPLQHGSARAERFRLNQEKIVTFDDGLRDGVLNAVGHALDAGWTVVLFVCPSFFGNTDLMYRHRASLLVETANTLWRTSPVLKRVSDMLSERGITGECVARKLLNVPYAQRDVLNTAAKALGVDVGGYARESRPYLGIDELRAFAQRGVQIGSHGLDHAPIAGTDINSAAAMVNDSLERISAIAPVLARLFSYPFGDSGVPQSGIDALIERCGLDYSFGTAGWRPERNPRHVQRLRMESTHAGCGIVFREIGRKVLRRLLGRSIPRRADTP
jgi:hypothetical protein